ncbi:hypothetical protein FXN61_15565 [Lentzea sp. PSKA42]|uniref:Secreted protein n=1 Tax=Lentzea indica TaxID=2604800 RepID=A0ABX1FGR8_9PSEU|nr:hypothetical protein [Lentzea indica]NKE58161.1 hypothetical protein [Lentzea indica]
MKNSARTVLATIAAVLTFGALTGAASADTRGGTPHGSHWYIGTGNAYGEVVWLDYDQNNSNDKDELVLKDDIFPSGYSVRMTVVHDSFKKTVRAYSGNSVSVQIPGLHKGEKAKFKACAWDNDDEVTCRPWTTVTE